jgi:hypothetical protein
MCLETVVSGQLEELGVEADEVTLPSEHGTLEAVVEQHP